MTQPRLPIVVRDAEPEDAAVLIDVWDRCAADAELDAGEAPPGAAGWRPPQVPEAADAIARTCDDDDHRLVVALLDGEVVGVVAMMLLATTPIHTSRTLIVSDLHVLPRYRRKAVASVLMSAAVTWAEDCGCDVVFTHAPATSRDSHRFLTRLGFGQCSTVRSASVSVLRSRFAGMATSSKDTGRLIAVRRTLRRRHTRAIDKLRSGGQSDVGADR